jgi:cytochrome c biogenesis protein CcmG/thiol:disulfide interchange protein DsbE
MSCKTGLPLWQLRACGNNVVQNRIVALAFGVALAFSIVAEVAGATAVGEPAPPFSLATTHGETIALPNLRGQVVYVDFWASWCGPCRRSFPWMNEMQQRYGDRGLTIIAINVDRRRADAERFLQSNAARFAVVFDDHGATSEAYSVKGMPSSYLIDARGNVVDVEQGFRDDRKAPIEEQIRALLSSR